MACLLGRVELAEEVSELAARRGAPPFDKVSVSVSVIVRVRVRRLSIRDELFNFNVRYALDVEAPRRHVRGEHKGAFLRHELLQRGVSLAC